MGSIGRGVMNRFIKRFSCGDAPAARRQLRDWYRSVVGEELLAEERRQLDSVLPNLFGYHLLQIGQAARVDLLGASRIKHRMLMGDSQKVVAGDETQPWVGECDRLAVATDSLDVVLLHHVLEFEPRPHEVLREVERALIAEGHVVILGFNPWSIWGLTRLMLGRKRKTPWCGHFYSTTRIKDWLALLGFDTVLVRYYAFRPPVQHETALHKLGRLEEWGARWWPLTGGGYLLVAKKRVTTLTPIKPRWRPRRSLLGSRLAEPTARRNEHES